MTASLYLIATVLSPQSGKSLSAVVEGKNPRLIGWVASANATSLAPLGFPAIPAGPICMVGGRIGKQLRAKQGSSITLSNGDQKETCVAAGLGESGGAPDHTNISKPRAAPHPARLSRRTNALPLPPP